MISKTILGNVALVWLSICCLTVISTLVLYLLFRNQSKVEFSAFGISLVVSTCSAAGCSTALKETNKDSD